MFPTDSRDGCSDSRRRDACATIVNAARRGLTGRSASVELPGGVLDMSWREDGHVLMTGPVATSFFGQVAL